MVKNCFSFCLRSLVRAVRNPRFWTKVVALLLNTVAITLWRLEEDGESGLTKNTSQMTLFAHTVPGYEMVLVGVVLIYLLGEEPGKFFHRLFFLSGIILFLVTGSIGIYNSLNMDPVKDFPLAIGIICIVVAIVFICDEVLNELLPRGDMIRGSEVHID